VLEVSSYQAADVTTSPRIGVLTSLGSDHLPWHRNSDECYRADKLRLFSGSGSTPLIVNGHDETAWTSTAMLSGRIDGCAGRWRAAGSTLAADGITIVIHDPITRAHNATNVLLALTAAEAALGRALDPVLVERTLADFRGLPARQQQVAVVDGVAYIDDAIASNPMGAIAALDVFDTSPLVVIIGGTDRNVDIAALVDRLAAVPELRAVITLADLGARVADEIERRQSDITVVRLPDDVATAVATAAQLASSGDTVLFSPAAATTPAVGTYLDRSRLFVDAVARLL
jgi:UDP-N-acetylmuramoyl-L-alanine---L-glutamate ligase